MTKKEYNEKKILLLKIYNSELQVLKNEYAMTNNPFYIGDIVKDQTGFAKILNVDHCTIILRKEFPECVYKCQVLKANKKPTKVYMERLVYQSNIKEVINEMS